MYTFITEDNRKSKRAKGINKNINDEPNMNITRIFCSIDHV